MVEKAVRISGLLGTLIISFIGIVLISNTVLFAVGSSLSGLTIPFAAMITGCVGWWASIQYLNENYRRHFLTISIGFVIIFVLTVFINSSIYDISFDGQTYHSEAIVALAQGWNPVRMPVPANAFYPDWVGFFTKGTWITAAAMYRFTGNIESGKVVNSLLLIASGLFSYSALSTFPRLKPRWRINLSILMMLNPVSLSQLFTFYVDGQLSSCLVILISLLIILNQQQDYVYLLALGFVLIIIMNIKLTGILYTGILVAGFIAWYWWHYRKLNRQLIACSILAAFISLGAVGFNPIVSQYTRNLLEKGDPFYPVSWSQLIAIDRNMPQDFDGKDRFSKLVISLFSKSQVSTKSSQLKIPFWLSVDELFDFRYPDVRTGGFGPLFGGGLILATLILITRFTRYRKHAYQPVLLALIGLIVISTISTSEAWWARYTPQFWLAPPLVAVMGIDTSLNAVFRWLTKLLLLILAINIILIASVIFVGIIKDQPPLRDELDYVKQIANKYGSIALVTNGFPITQSRFEQLNITYTLPDKLPCDSKHQHVLIYSWSAICDPGLTDNRP